MREVQASEQKAILEYLAPHVEECLYLYLDIYWYGIGSDTIKVWCGDEKDGEYSFVVMKYFNCFQLYSKHNDFDPAELIELAKAENVDRVFARKDTIEYLQPAFGEGYVAEFGEILELNKHRDFGDMYSRIEEATAEDLPEVTKLLLMDEENALSYNYEELLETLQNLISSGMGRTFILREDGKIVATVSISAETDIFMIGAYTMVHPDYRHTLYGMLVDSYVNRIIRGDKRLFGFVMDSRRIRMFKALGNKVVAEYGKLIRV